MKQIKLQVTVTYNVTLTEQNLQDYLGADRDLLQAYHASVAEAPGILAEDLYDNLDSATYLVKVLPND